MADCLPCCGLRLLILRSDPAQAIAARSSAAGSPAVLDACRGARPVAPSGRTEEEARTIIKAKGWRAHLSESLASPADRSVKTEGRIGGMPRTEGSAVTFAGWERNPATQSNALAVSKREANTVVSPSPQDQWARDLLDHAVRDIARRLALVLPEELKGKVHALTYESLCETIERQLQEQGNRDECTWRGGDTMCMCSACLRARAVNSPC